MTVENAHAGSKSHLPVAEKSAGPSNATNRASGTTRLLTASGIQGERQNSDLPSGAVGDRHASSQVGKKVKKRQADKVYDHVELIPGSQQYKCLGCNKVLGQRNTTRFKKHCIQQCVEIHSPLKRELLRTSRSKALDPPQERSRIGLALERQNMQERDDPTVSADPEDLSHGKAQPSGNANAKKRKIVSNQSEKHCSPGEVQFILSSLMEYIIMKGVPFNLFEREKGQESAAEKLFRSLNPTFTKYYLPSGRNLSGKLLDNFHSNIKTNVVHRIKSALSQGYGSLIFDGWDDVNSSPVVNVLLRTEGNIDAGRRIFFLASVFTGSKTTGAKEYVKILEEVMNAYGGLPRICAVTSDNTSCCLNTRKELTMKYGGIVGINDQSHVADLLIEDMGKLPWISDVLKKVSDVSKELHGHRKLKERFKTIQDGYNGHVKAFRSSQGPEADLESNTNTDAASHLSSFLGGDRNPQEISVKRQDEVRTAMMLRQSSNTRFASAEGVLDSFIRSLNVLRLLVAESDFNILFKPRNADHRKKRDEGFVGVIKDQNFCDSVIDIHRLLLVLRRYLRIFDADHARISEVLIFTDELEKNLSNLLITSFFTNERKDEVLSVFRKRRNGPINRSIRVRLVDDVHYVAVMLDPNLCPDNSLDHIQKFRSHAERYASSIQARDTRAFVNRLVLTYMSQREIWRRERDGMSGGADLKLFQGNALMWWYAGNCEHADLKEFAVRTLSCSPTSCAVERSFSAQKKIQRKERNRLSREKVQKMIFCYWNIKLMKNMDVFNKHEFWQSVNQAISSISQEEDENDSDSSEDQDGEDEDGEDSDENDIDDAEAPVDTEA